jgi:hypothetical protein
MQEVSKVILFLREGKFAARAKRVRKCAELKKDNLLMSCIQNFLVRVSLDNNFFDTQNLKIFSCVNPWTFKMLVLLAF